MTTAHLLEERLAHSVIGAFYQVYDALGFGFLEHVYAMALEQELRERGHAVGREEYVPVLEPAFYRLVRTRPRLTEPAPTSPP